MNSKILSIIFVSISLILGACGEDSNLHDAEFMSESYHDELIVLMDSYLDYTEIMVSDNVSLANIEKESTSYLDYLDSLEFNPVTSLDRTVHDDVLYLKSCIESNADLMLRYANTGMEHYKERAGESLEEVNKVFGGVDGMVEIFGVENGKEGLKNELIEAKEQKKQLEN